MPKFKCSYGYDVSHFADFVVEAESEDKANAMIRKAFKDGCFGLVQGEAYYENVENERVFVSCVCDEDEAALEIPMEKLEGFKKETDES